MALMTTSILQCIYDAVTTLWNNQLNTIPKIFPYFPHHKPQLPKFSLIFPTLNPSFHPKPQLTKHFYHFPTQNPILKIFAFFRHL